jgi:hypothetical protein
MYTCDELYYVQEANRALRRSLGAERSTEKTVYTWELGIASSEERSKIVKAIRDWEPTPKTEPDHSQGEVCVSTERYLFEITYYDSDFRRLSDPLMGFHCQRIYIRRAS